MKTLLEQLERGRQFSAEYKAGLSNHLPMALIALHRLGATEARRERFYDEHAPRLELLSGGPTELAPSEVLQHFGERDSEATLRYFFERTVREAGRKEVLRAWLPRLMPGVSAGAFHPLIRTAYGVDAGDDGEVVAGLASFAMSFQTLPISDGRDETPDSATPLSILNAISRDVALSARKVTGSSIYARLAKVGTDSDFQQHVRPLPAMNATVASVAAIARALYASSGDNFTALHTVTAAHAMRVLVPYFDDPATAVRHFWHAVAAAYVTIGAPHIDGEAPLLGAGVVLPSWDVIHEAAIGSPDDHVIKLVYTCLAEADHYQDDRYRILAATKAKLLSRGSS